jgi:hypothetical protein
MATTAFVAGSWMIYAGGHTEGPPLLPDAAQAVPRSVQAAVPHVHRLAPSPPNRVRIRRIAVDAPVMGLTAAGPGICRPRPRATAT